MRPTGAGPRMGGTAGRLHAAAGDAAHHAAARQHRELRRRADGLAARSDQSAAGTSHGIGCGSAGRHEDGSRSAEQDDARSKHALHLRPRRHGRRRTAASIMFTLTLDDFIAVRARIAPHIKHTPLLTSRQLSERTGFDVRLKAEMFQRVGSYKIRGPLNKFALMPEEQKARGVVCSSAGNHAQGVALAAKIHGIRAVVCMAENATPAKIAATPGYGAQVGLHGTIWAEADERGKG